MDYDYACFISYKRPPKPVYPSGVTPPKATKHIWLQFAEAFEEKLSPYLTTRIGIFRDEYLQPGIDYQKQISQSLCRSVCMVALVVPEYFESKWCVAEWLAMQDLEEKRLGRGKQELIIPVVCVGEFETLENYLGTRLAKAFDIRNIVSPSRQLNTLTNLRKIEAIARMING